MPESHVIWLYRLTKRYCNMTSIPFCVSVTDLYPTHIIIIKPRYEYGKSDYQVHCMQRK